jgi:chromatin remodeling complex protein RSC6
MSWPLLSQCRADIINRREIKIASDKYRYGIALVLFEGWRDVDLRLQNPANRREIVADDQLRRVFGKDKVTMFEMNKHLAAHLT